MKNLQISVYITSYNQANYLCQAIESVLSQSLTPCEILIIDDFSEDGSREIIKQYHKKNPELIKYHFSSRNYGIAKTRNIALSQLKGDCVTFLDGDDIFYNDKLLFESLALIENREVDIAFSDYKIIDANGNLLGEWKLTDYQGDLFERSWTFQWPWGGPFRSPMINLRKWKENDLYDESLEIFEDLDMMLRLSRYYQSVHVAKPLSAYRKHSKGISNQGLKKTIHILDFIYKKNDNLLNNLPDDQIKRLNLDRDKFLRNMRVRLIYQTKQEKNYLQTLVALIKLSFEYPQLLRSKIFYRILFPW